MESKTHVLGLVKIHDAARLIDAAKIDAIFGKALPPEASAAETEYAFLNPEEYMFQGCTGSLQKVFLANMPGFSEPTSLVIVYGDLLGVDNSEEVIWWFRKICCSNEPDVADAFIEVQKGGVYSCWSSQQGTSLGSIDAYYTSLKDFSNRRGLSFIQTIASLLKIEGEEQQGSGW